MLEAGLGAAFVLGLVGSGHCLAMCSGIAGALHLAIDRDRSAWWVTVSAAGYQGGRIVGYGIAGALAGAAGGGLSALAPAPAARCAGMALQAAVLVLLGLYLTGWWRAPMATVEGLGLHLWRALGPVRRRLLPVRSAFGALGIGLLWGLLPCGLVYSALAVALASGGAAHGALSMLAFGAGTLPAVVAAGGALGRVGGLRSGSALRRAAGIALLAAGVAVALGSSAACAA